MTVKSLNILLAEDDMDDRYFFEQAIKELPEKIKLSSVIDGEKLMAYLFDENALLPDIIFLDINMPRKNGLDCLNEIKQNERLKNLPVVMFSTAKSQETINLLFKKGAHIYIHKPGDFSQLKEVIHHALPIITENKLAKKEVKYILNA